MTPKTDDISLQARLQALRGTAPEVSSLQARFLALNPSSSSPAVAPISSSISPRSPSLEPEEGLPELLQQLGGGALDHDQTEEPQDEEASIQALLKEAEAALGGVVQKPEYEDAASDDDLARGDDQAKTEEGRGKGEEEDEDAESSEQSSDAEGQATLARLLDEVALERNEEVSPFLRPASQKSVSPPPVCSNNEASTALDLPSVPTTLLPSSPSTTTGRHQAPKKAVSWCAICTDDATIRCLGCEAEAGGGATDADEETALYCARCWREGHLGEDAGMGRGHQWEKFRP